MDKSTLRFVRQIMLGLLLGNEEECCQVSFCLLSFKSIIDGLKFRHTIPGVRKGSSKHEIRII